MHLGENLFWKCFWNSTASFSPSYDSLREDDTLVDISFNASLLETSFLGLSELGNVTIHGILSEV
jgi:hypothetical protein